MKIETIKCDLEKYINDEKVISLFLYGSFVYDTYIDGKSDIDCIMIVSNDYLINTDRQIKIIKNNTHYDINIYDIDTWFHEVENCSVEVMECLSLPINFNLKYSKDIFRNYIFNPKLIRESFSKTASNSFVKCKKKLIIEKDFNPIIAKKSLWHSLRLIDFATQIFNYNKIVDYSSTNKLLVEIIKTETNNWNYFKENYQYLYNEKKHKMKVIYNDKFI